MSEKRSFWDGAGYRRTVRISGESSRRKRSRFSGHIVRRLEGSRVSKAFGNDILLTLSCREHGCVLVTKNGRDFARIRQFVKFAFVGPWPMPLA